MKNNLLFNAAQHILGEVLGCDEGKAYYLMLLNKENQLDAEFSYSKKYRVLKALFSFGALGKFKIEQQDFFRYLLLPPTFLHFNDIESEIVEFLEKIYIENHSAILDSRFSQIILKDEKSLLIFLLKYFMTENAKLVTSELEDIREILKDKGDRVFARPRIDGEKSIGVIDRKFVFEFVNIPMAGGKESIGYISNNRENVPPRASQIEKEVEQVFYNSIV
ncbi:MAG: hypothetical protein V1659_02165 [Candidatus Woesearchaeota archaeon]